MSKFNTGIDYSLLNTNSGLRDFFAKRKVLIIFLLFVLLVSVLTGVFTAIKNVDNYSAVWFDNYNIIEFYNSDMGTWDLFFNRFGSYFICLCVIFVSSFTIYLSPFSLVVLVLRGYLVGINCTFMFMLFGLGGMLVTIFVILPVQILSLLVLIIFTTSMFVRAYNKHRYGSYCVGNEKKQYVLFLLFVLVLTLLNVVETLLLFIFSSKIILVI